MQIVPIHLATDRLVLTSLNMDDAEAMVDYYQRNWLTFKPWEPERDDSFFNVDKTVPRISAMAEAMAKQQAVHFLLKRHDSVEIVGQCAFTNIVRGPFQACHLGFSICKTYEGKGLMQEALRRTIDFVFGELCLHRVMANYRPENERSHRLLQRLGFEQEGLARSYLKIDGDWRDHVLTSLINGTYC